jgi:serine/threonine protein kinase
MTLSPGARLGPYEILALLGAGGMGEVYRARDSRLGRTVAIKILPQHVLDSPTRRQRFEREARTASRLSHPHICALYDIGEHDQIHFIVMEHLEGQTLAERLRRGPLPVVQVLRCAIEIADALHHAHRAGIVHRDLKPANVMLTPSGAKLLDFGVARLAESGDSEDAQTLHTAETEPITEAGTILGTLHDSRTVHDPVVTLARGKLQVHSRGRPPVGHDNRAGHATEARCDHREPHGLLLARSSRR